MSDHKTIDAYNEQVGAYVKLVSRDKPDRDLRAFMDALPKGGAVLDLGCGPGNTAAIMQDAGFEVAAWDASVEMVRTAQDKYGLNAVLADFDDLSATERFDGVFANFSLLHAKRIYFESHLKAIRVSLRSGGVFHLGMKLGAGEKRDSLGRFYTYYTLEELKEHLTNAGFVRTEHREGSGTGLSGNHEPFAIIRAYA